MKRPVTDQDIREYFGRVVRDAVAADDATTKLPTWVAVAVASMLERARRAHGGQSKGGRAKVWETTALIVGRHWWEELREKKVPEPQRKAAERVKAKMLPHLSVETIMRRMRDKSGGE